MKNLNYLFFAFLMFFTLNINAQQNDEEITAASRSVESLKHASNSTSIITENDLNNKKSFNFLGLLDNTVGVNISRQGANSFNISLREGVDIYSTQALIISDGRELNNYGLKFFDAPASTLSGLDIERIEVVRGSSGAVYGLNASSGVVSVKTKNPFDFPGTTVSITSGGINKNGSSSILSGSESDVQSNWNLFNVNLRHADHNEDNTFGYKINLRYSENSDWLFTGLPEDVVGGQLPLMSSFNFDTSLYYNYDDYDLTLTFGTNDTENVQRRQIWGEEKRDMRSTFFNAKVETGDLFAQYSITSNSAPRGSEGTYNYFLDQDLTIESRQSHLQIGYEFPLDDLNTKITLGADSRVTKFDTKEKVFGQYENNDDFRTLGASLQSKTKLSDNISVLFQGRYDHFNVVNKGAFSPKGVIFIDDNTGGSLRLSMSQSHNTDNAYTLFSDYAASSWDGGYMGPYGNAGQLTFSNPTWRPWGNLSEAVNANPAANFNVLGMDHFSVFLMLSSNIVDYIVGQFLATGDTLWLGMASPSFITNMLSVGGASYTEFDLVDMAGNPMNMQDSDKTQLSTETTYELGYSNSIGDKFSFSVDVYNIRKQNIVAAKQITPLAGIDGAKLSSDFFSTMSSALARTYAGLGVPASFAASYINTISAVSSLGAAQLASTIGTAGIIQADQARTDIDRVYWGHYNFGDINYWGADFSTNYDFSSSTSLFLNYSFINQTEFEKEDVSGGNEISPDVYHLNIPKHRVKGGFAYNPTKGFNFGLSFRYQNSMSINTLNSSNQSLFYYEGFIPKRTVWDMNIGIPFNSKTRLDLSVDNVLGKKYQTFGNMPMVGQQALFTLTHNF